MAVGGGTQLLVAESISPKRIRYEKRVDIHEAFLALACALICWAVLQKHAAGLHSGTIECGGLGANSFQMCATVPRGTALSSSVRTKFKTQPL